MNSRITKIFYWLFWGMLLTPLVYSRGFDYPFIIPKALFFQTLVELLLPVYIYIILTRKTYRPNLKNPLTIAVLVFLGINFISAIFGINFAQSFWGIAARMSGLFNLFHLVLVYFYILLLGELEGGLLDRVIRTTVWIATIIASYGIWVRLGLPSLYQEVLLPRISSLFGNPIFLASFLIIPIFLTAFLVYNEERKNKRWMYVAFCFLQILALYFTQTRGAYLGLAAGVFISIVVYFSFYHKKQLRLYGLGGLLIVILVSGFIIFPKLKFTDNDSQARLIQWRTALKGLKGRPLIGTGPENYYVIADTYNNSEIYKYDAGWWDKPHNILLEILTTTGVIGFASYLSVIGFVLWNLWLSYREEILGRTELSILVGGFIAYLVQNLFVFDTISASVMFYIFLGIVASLAPQKEVSGSKSYNISTGKIVASAAALVALLTIYIGNILPARAAKLIEQAVKTNDPKQAKIFLEHAAVTSPNISILGEVGSNFEDIAVKSANIDGIDPVFVNQFAQSGIGVLEKVTTKEDTIPYYWLKLASLYYLEAYSSQGNIGESLNQAHNAVLKTQELVPNRVEAMILDAKIKLAQNQISEAESIMGEVMAIVPKDPSSQWHFKYKKDALAVYDLLIRYYAAKEDYSRVLDLYLKEVSLDPNNFQLYSGLAATYAKLGQKDKAIEAANKVVELEPAAREDTQKFIESLK